MNDIQTLTSFFGWCSVINIGVLLVSSILLMLAKGPISSIHSKMFGVSQEALGQTYFQYLGNYKIMIFIFNIVPYIALRILA